MKNKLDEVVKERLENRYQWRDYLIWILLHRNLQKNAKKEFYKNKPLLSLLLEFYFLPYNTMKYLIYLSDRHKYNRIEKEIQMLKNIMEKSNEEKF
tara:strand:+ start:201 stop:488 length:288 start_codon:yes stop_codon:yes gene_type:complete